MGDLPHITVATVVARQIQGDSHFLMVREQADGAVVYNQPAGHVECGESLQQAALRETIEETGWLVTLTCLLGIYQYTSAANGISYVRHCFVAEAVRQEPAAELDATILAAEWLSSKDIASRHRQLRSPMVWQAINDYQRGLQFPLNLIQP